MSPADLYQIIRELPAVQPDVDEAICRWWPQSCERDERQHWLDWLAEHELRGTAHAHRVWRNIQSPPMLLWLMAASGVDPDVINLSAAEAAAFPHRATQCRILRDSVSWQMVRRNLLNRSPRK